MNLSNLYKGKSSDSQPSAFWMFKWKNYIQKWKWKNYKLPLPLLDVQVEELQAPTNVSINL
jgi:hypothetical protein